MESIALQVPDMSCGHCVQAVSAAVGQVDGVGDVRVDLDTKRVEVTGSALDPDQIAAAIRAAGYEAER